MLIKKVFSLCLVFFLCSFLVTGCVFPQLQFPRPTPQQTPTATPTATIMPTPTPTSTAPDYIVGDLWTGQDSENYWGPYGYFTLSDGALVFDCGVNIGYCTINFKDKPTPVLKYKYVVVSMKVDNTAFADDALGAYMTFGNVGKSLTDWGISGLTTSYKTFVIDLAGNGLTQWGASFTPDFALNQVYATTAKIYIDKLVLTNFPESMTPDYTIQYTVGEFWASPDSENYWGPYGPDFSLADGALVFDCGAIAGWCTLNFKDRPSPALKYKYAVVSMKVDYMANADDALGAHMTFGNVGKSLADWGISGLTTSYKTFVIDLDANGLTQWGVNVAPDFAMNQVDAMFAKISIDKIALANPD